MDWSRLIERAKNLLFTPKTEWPVIAGEATTIADLYRGTVVIYAAVPALFGFLAMSVVGVSFGPLGSARVPFFSGLTAAVLQYAMSLAMIYVLGLVVEALAPTFGGQKDRLQAVKVVAYAAVPAWLASVGQLVPGLGGLLALAGGVYTIYLLYLGLPVLMRCPAEKAGGYTAATVVAGIVLGILIGVTVGAVSGASRMAGMGGMHGAESAALEADPDSPLGKLEAYSEGVADAGRKLEEAQRSGDQAAQTEALGAMLGAALGGGSVEALAPDQLKAFAPEAIDGLARTSLSAERKSAMGLQVTEVEARYGDGARSLRLELTDTGAARSALALAGFGLESERESNGRVERTYRDDGRLVHEEWDDGRSQGEYAVVVGERFTVRVRGEAESLGDLKDVVESLELDDLEALKDSGVSAP